MSATLLSCVEIEPPASVGPARRAVVWLHGLGADGHDFEPIVPELGLDPELAVRFVFPHAPSLPVTINGGMVMPAWYDIVALGARDRGDVAGVRRSAERIEQLVQRERERGIAPEHILLAGFSQGGAVANHLALRYPERLAGLMGLSTYVVAPDTLAEERSPANRDLPIFQAHGTFDPMVPLAAGEEARDLFVSLGHEVEWHTYPMQHQVCLEEIHDVARWMARCLA